MTDNDTEAMSMLERLSSLAADVTESLDGAAATTTAGATELARDGSVFARVIETGLEVRLPADIAEAAKRTPDTATIDDDAEWLRFEPASDEQHALDRAEAWLLTAWRHAG